MSSPFVSAIQGNGHASGTRPKRSVMTSRLPVTMPIAAPAEDRLSTLLERFPLRAGVFHTGLACGSFDFDPDVKPGHFHLVRSGRALLIDADERTQPIEEPSVVFFPDARSHRLLADCDLELVCATVRFGIAGASPVVGALPAWVIVTLREAPLLAALSELISAEVYSDRPGRQAALNRLCELAVVTVLRFCLDTGLASGSAFAGLADLRLAKALEAMHGQPEREWTLEALARLVGMSRARFASRFREVVQATPGEHLAACRMVKAQQLLRQGGRLKWVAEAVGYASASAFTRAFTRVVGIGPAQWASAAGQAQGRGEGAKI